MLQGLPPLLTPRTRILLLGSFPSEASLRQGQYYAHPRNQFWRLVGACLGVGLYELPYAERLAVLAARDVGLWDVVGTCRREGSLDSAIEDHSVNPLAEVLRVAAPALRRIGFNGGKAWALGHRLGEAGYEVYRLPSSSPAAARLTFEAKLAQWQGVFEEER